MEKTKIIEEEGDSPPGKKEIIIEEAFIFGDGTIVNSRDIMRKIKNSPIQATTVESRPRSVQTSGSMIEVMSKSMDGSNQIFAQDNDGIIQLNTDLVQPPLNPDIMTRFLESEGTHFRCVLTKVTDSVGREWKLIKNPKLEMADIDIPDDIFKRDKAEIIEFLDGANEIFGWEEAAKKAAMDYESIGYCGLEIVRSFDKKVVHIYHVPGDRLRVLRGWNGFVEQNFTELDFDTGFSGAGIPSQSLSNNQQTQQLTYYLPFGQKVLSPDRVGFDGKPKIYDPMKDNIPIEEGVWNLVDKFDPNIKLSFDEINRSANELLYIPKAHPKSIYYGLPDWIPATGSILGNINIRDYFLQFFDHNTIPQYAVIITGAKLSPSVQQTIMNYFSTEIKGHAHKTLVIPIPAAGGDVKVEFKALSTDVKEGSFQETRINNQKEIIIAHGLTQAVVGMAESSELGSGKGNAQQENYKNRVVDPIQRVWERKWAKLFRHGLGIVSTVLKYNDLDAADRTTQRQNLVEYMKVGALTLNQIREKAELGGPVDGGDRAFYVTSAGIPVFIDQLQAIENLLLSTPDGSDEDDDDEEDVQKIEEAENIEKLLTKAQIRENLDILNEIYEAAENGELSDDLQAIFSTPKIGRVSKVANTSKNS